MVTFTPRDVKDLRADLADTHNRWDQGELEHLMDRAYQKYPRGTAQQLVDIACAIGLGQLLGNAAKFFDWVVAEEQAKKSDIWKQLNGILEGKLRLGHVRAAFNVEGGASGQIVTRKLGYSRTRGRRDEFSRPGY